MRRHFRIAASCSWCNTCWRLMPRPPKWIVTRVGAGSRAPGSCCARSDREVCIPTSLTQTYRTGSRPITARTTVDSCESKPPTIRTTSSTSTSPFHQPPPTHRRATAGYAPRALAEDTPRPADRSSRAVRRFRYAARSLPLPAGLRDMCGPAGSFVDPLRDAEVRCRPGASYETAMISAGIQIAMSGARRRPFALWAQRVVALLSASGLRG
jgi:hypothetical protein